MSYRIMPKSVGQSMLSKTGTTDTRKRVSKHKHSQNREISTSTKQRLPAALHRGLLYSRRKEKYKQKRYDETDRHDKDGLT